MHTKFQSHSTVIRGVTYITVSCYEREEAIFERVGHLILNDYMLLKEGEVTNESLFENDIDFEAE